MKTREKQKNRRKDQRQAIRTKCMICSYNDFQEVRNCELTDCALYAFRTGGGRPDADEISKAIYEFCMWCKDSVTDDILGCDIKDCSLYYFRIIEKKPVKWSRTF